MMTCTCKMPSNLLRIVAQNWTPIISNTINQVTQVILTIVQSPGFCPVDKGNLRDGHFVENLGSLARTIKCNVEYWVYIVYGHRVPKIQSEAQRKAFFAKMASGEVSAPKGVDFVQGDNYIFRAVLEAFKSGAVDKIIKNNVRIAIRGV